VNFLKSLEFWRNIKYQMMQLKMHGLYVCQEVVPNCEQQPEGGVGHPFLAVGELKEDPQAPVREHVTPFNTAGHLPVARWGTPVPFRTPCGSTQAISPT
jgi:hypothetical protein